MEVRRRKGQGSNIIIIFKLIASVSSVGIVGVVVSIINFSLTSFILGVISVEFFIFFYEIKLTSDP